MPPEPPSYPDSSGAETDAAAHPSEPEALHGGRRWAELGWWGVLALLVVGTVYVQAAGVPRPEGGGPPPAERTDLILQAEYLLGVAGIAERAAPGMLDSLPGAAEGELLAGLARAAVEPRDHLALAPVYAELGQEQEARAIVGRVERAARGAGEPGEGPPAGAGSADRGEPKPPPTDPELAREASAFSGLLDEPPRLPDPEAEERLLGTYGWFAELALARARGEGAVAELRSRAERIALGLAAAIPLGLGCLGLGVLLLGWAMARNAGGRWRWAYSHTPAGPQPDSADRLPYLETVVVFIVALQLVGALAATILIESDSLWPLALNWLILPVIFWPVLRGRRPAQVLHELGWHRGTSIPAEVAWGLVAYVASLPILAIGLALSMLFAALGDAQPYHPVVDWIGSGSPLALPVIFLLAAVWAPIVEESVFRGAFYHYLRGRAGMLASAVVVALIFACLHPQGWVGLPFLVCLATVLAVAREWRGSLVACVTMHFVHNGLAVALMAFLFR